MLHVHPVTHTHAGDHRSKGDALPPAAPPTAAGQLAQDQRLIGGHQARPRRDAELVLRGRRTRDGTAPPRCQPDRARRAAFRRALRPGASSGAPIGAAGFADAREVELVLERGDQAPARLPLSSAASASFKVRAQATFPGPAVGVREVTQDEAIAGFVGAESTLDPGAGVGLEQEVAERAERGLRDSDRTR